MNTGPPFDTIIFDCDSTLSTLEGIDELAKSCRETAEIEELTLAAMNGDLPLEDVYKKRLELIRPNLHALSALGRRYIEDMTPDAGETIRILQNLDKQIHIVSGGILQAVTALGESLGIAPENIHAVEIDCDESGQYRGYNEAHPLARSQGKQFICEEILRRNPGKAALVGDGITDLEAAAAGVYIVGYGGVTQRDVVRQRADAYVDSPSLLGILKPLLTLDERSMSQTL